jgi:nitroreductase
MGRYSRSSRSFTWPATVVQLAPRSQEPIIDNAILAAIQTRRSTHTFESAPITDRQLESILDAGRWAPSGLNSQPWDFIVVKDLEARAEVADLLQRITISWKGFATAPVMIVVSVDPSRDPDHFVEDGAVAAQNLCLASHSLGLASSWAGVYGKGNRRGSVENALKTLLSLPRTHRVIAVIPIGHANGDSRTSSRIPLKEMVHHDRFRPSQRYRS